MTACRGFSVFCKCFRTALRRRSTPHIFVLCSASFWLMRVSRFPESCRGQLARVMVLQDHTAARGHEQCDCAGHCSLHICQQCHAERMAAEASQEYSGKHPHAREADWQQVHDLAAECATWFSESVNTRPRPKLTRWSFSVHNHLRKDRSAVDCLISAVATSGRPEGAVNCIW